ncbi:hypothetical protein DL96DRAFT_1744220 [Flagelloscypha sp. PMI_526]|nr:hypothetical protein DL96DRAFT_1744220 [Flagelloscypha sp. PMI_526]
MAEVLNVLVAFAVIIFVFRWVTSGGSGDPASDKTAEILGFRPKNVTREMISTISTMFPDLPVDNIRYDLLRSGSVERTTNKILEKGYLEAPPASYYRVYPRSTPNPPPLVPAAATATSSVVATKSQESLISRFGLQTKVEEYTPSSEQDGDNPGGKSAWEDSREAREASLKERKERMILAARQRMLAQEKGKGKEKAI